MTYRLTCSMTAPVGLNFRVLTPKLEMRRGAEIDYTIRWLGLPLRRKTLIAACDPPRQFVDRQARGPFLLWRHTHTSRETAAGTEVRDQVDYPLPLRLLGRVAHALAVKRQLLGIFRCRQHRIAAILAVPCIVCGEPAAGPLIA